jgi:quercetin 2,3-dioxygenase
MSLTLRRGADRGHSQIDWLDSRHTFSFADYHDPRHMGFRTLRVINDDRVQPGQGFGTHFHRDMEILSYVLEGSLAHKDSMGNGSVIRPGDLQRMSAGRGVEHSEFNSSDREIVHFLQIWITPERRGIEPGYEQRHFTADQLRDRLRLVASREGTEGSVSVHQNVAVYLTKLSKGAAVRHELRPQHHAWVHVATGAVSLNGNDLAEGDGASLSGERSVELVASRDAEVLLFDLA